VLKTRILTALIALPLFLAALFLLSDVYWGLLLLILAVVGAWEWGKLAKFHNSVLIAYLLLTLVLGGAALFFCIQAELNPPRTTWLLWIYASTFLFWVIVVPLYLRTHAAIKHPVWAMLVGCLVLLPTVLAMFQLRAISPDLLLGFMATIWISDTAAYFAGRAFGKHKLAPNTSPGKTWEGVAGAMLAVLIYALAWHYYFGGVKILGIWIFPLLLLLTALGIVGDLFESLMKRQAGVKDSGHLLPGHGGILDRIDALTSTLPVAILALLLLA
jgi:phosphatidate cytidylyltransferase